MEDVLAVYELPYDIDYPVVCMDESCKQLVGEVHEAIPCAPGRPARVDDEYVRNGVAEIFLEVEPLTGKRHVAATEHRTRKDWAWWIKGMLDERYPNAVRVRLVMDNLNTQCLDRRIPDLQTLQSEIAAWEGDRNNRQPKIHWHFSTTDARIKLKRLYPNL